MKIVRFTLFRLLKWQSEVMVEDDTDREEVEEAIQSVIPQKNRDFESEIQEYAVLEDGTRIGPL